MVFLYSFFNLGTRWSWSVNARPRPFYPLGRNGTHCTGGWVGLRVGLDSCGKSRPPPGIDPRIVQSVASHYIDWAISAHIIQPNTNKYSELFQNNYQQDDTYGLSFISGLVVLHSTCFELQGAHHQEFTFLRYRQPLEYCVIFSYVFCSRLEQ